MGIYTRPEEAAGVKTRERKEREVLRVKLSLSRAAWGGESPGSWCARREVTGDGGGRHGRARAINAMCFTGKKAAVS